MAQVKTNAMRILDALGVSYGTMTYDCEDGKIDGLSVAQKVGKDPETVYKTLVTQGQSKNIYVFVIPVEAELDLKKAASAAGEKKVEMLPMKDLQKWTGYIRGGCSPVGMKKAYPTYLDESAQLIEVITVSGGKQGIQIEMTPRDLEKVTGAVETDLIK